MAPKSKKSESASAPVAVAAPSAPAKTQSMRWDTVVSDLVAHYAKNTPQRTKLIDVFMAYLAVVGAVQFLYCILAGNYVRLDPRTGARSWEVVMEGRANKMVAVQCVPVGLRRQCCAVRPHWQVALSRACENTRC
ncbi:hypothetical protein IMZ48_22045 [Candidatus Bathyarchaeota archaeon]|nr:hypothetical protein [Candidatus Bathyarchaeota archaeon]